MAEGSRGDLMISGRVVAGMDLLMRSGVRNVELAYDDIEEEPKVHWWAEGNWNGHRVFSTYFPYPAHAVEDLLGKVINGGQCTRCGQTTVLGLDVLGYCCFWIEVGDIDDPQTYRYVRTCDETKA